MEEVLDALDERRLPHVPVVAAVQLAELGGDPGDALGRVVEHGRLEVEVVVRVDRVRVRVLVVADRDEQVDRQARVHPLQEARVVEVLCRSTRRTSRPRPKAP